MAPKYLQLYETLAEMIRKGAYPAGGKLPTEMELADAYHVSRQTVRLALALLVERGLIRKKQGSGIRVALAGPDKKIRRVAVVVSHAGDYIFPAILQDVQAVLARNDFSCQVFATHNKVGLEADILRRIVAQTYDGVLAEGVKTALPSPNLPYYRQLKKQSVPLLFLHGRCAGLEDAACISDDNVAGGYMLTRHLISKGHTCIGGVFNSDDAQGRLRYQGYAEALRDAGLPVPDDKLLWFSTEDRYCMLENCDLTILSDYVKNRLRGCTALVVYNDEIAYQVVSVLQKAGRSVPGAVAVVSFDNSYYCGLSAVPITSLGHEGERIGIVAAEALLRVMAGGEAASVALPWKLIERESG